MRKVKWGVMGTAGIAQGQTIPGMQLAENCELYAIAGRSLEKAKSFQMEFGFEKAYGSYEALLTDPEVEAVYIPLPNHLHEEWAIEAMQAKKHVLCEKPLAPSAAQAENMFRVAEENGVVLMEAFAYLHSPFVSALKEEIDTGAIGDVIYVESAFVTGARGDSDIRMRKETFGGALYDLGCYNTSLALWMIGEEPADVHALAEFTKQGIDIYTSSLLSFPGGARAELACGMVLRGEKGVRIDRIQIHGTKGSLYSSTRFNQPGEVQYTVRSNGESRVKTLTVRNNYTLEVEQLGRCITNGEKPHVSRDFSLMNARTLDGILQKIGY